jgi:hypothetical protein
MPGVPTVPTMPGADQQPRIDPTQPQLPQQPTIPTDALGQAGGRGTLGDVAGTPPIFGDLLGFQSGRLISLAPGVTPPKGAKLISGNRAIVVAPVPYRGAFKITENDSPRPTTRIYFNYNYYDNVENAVQSSFGTSAGHADLHRETIGFEYAFLDGDASVGLRLPLIQLTGNGNIEDSQAGDLTAIFKYALLNDRDTGNLLSVGLVLTIPTAPGVAVQGESVINPWIFQPFVGGIYNFSQDFYVQGFSSLVVPTDERDVTVFFNSLSFGYWMYRNNDADAGLRAIIPVFEAHISTPFNHRGTDHADPLFYQDTVNLTGGAHFLFQRADLGIAAGVPLTGVKPYDFELNASLNFRF